MKPFIAIICILSSNCFFKYAQNVGIGTSDPVRGKLVVAGVAGSGATTAIFGDQQAGISLQQNWPTIGFNQYRDLITPGSYGKFMKTGYAALLSLGQDNGIFYLDMYGYNNGGQYTGTGILGWAVKPTGQMAIGHYNPGATLDVIRGNNIYAPDGTAAFRGTTYNSHFNYSSAENTYIRAGKPGGHLFLNDIPFGNIYLGGGATVIGVNTTTTAGAGTLVINQNNQEGIGLIQDDWGNLRWELNNEHYNADPNAPTACLALRYSGRATTLMGWFRPTDGGYSDNSDIRLKENIRTMEPVLQKLLRLKPMRYQFISSQPGKNQSIGFIAQDVKVLFPELVDIRESEVDITGKKMDIHGMNYQGISVLAVRAIQEQQQEIDQLKKQLKQLEQKLDQLQKK